MLTICRPGGAEYFYTVLAINIPRLTARLLRQSCAVPILNVKTLNRQLSNYEKKLGFRKNWGA